MKGKTHQLKSRISAKVDRVTSDYALRELDELLNGILVAEKKGDWFKELTRTEKNNIEKSLKQVRAGKVIDDEKVQARAKLWLRK